MSEEGKKIAEALCKPDYEKALIGFCLTNEDEFLVAQQLLQADDFFVSYHRGVWREMVNLKNLGRPMDLVTLSEQFMPPDDLVVRGLLVECISQCHFIHKSMLPWYCTALKNKRKLRNLYQSAQEVVKDIEAEYPFKETSPEELADRMQAKLDVEREPDGSREPTKYDLAESTYKKIKEIAEGKQSPGLPFGIAELDRLTCGAQNTDMIILAARPGVGKTALAINIGDFMASQGRVVGFLSLEMNNFQLQMRSMAAHAKVSLQDIRSGRLSAHQLELLREAAVKTSTYKIIHSDLETINIHQIRSKARFWKSKYGLEILILDYLQLVSGTHERERNRQEEVSAISRGLKALAKELGIPIFALAQLNRSSEENSSKRPKLHNLRESGAIEQDADMVLLLHCSHALEEGRKKPDTLAYELEIAKQRSGPTDIIDLVFQSQFTSFSGAIK